MNSDSEDEFFGDQSDDEYSSHKCLSSSHTQEEPARLIDSLSKRDNNAQEENYRNIGYHEAYDLHKEERIQEGFEDGYRDHLSIATTLGEVLAKNILSNKIDVNREDEGNDRESNTTTGSESKILLVRNFLETVQNIPEGSNECKNSQDDIRLLIEKLQDSS
jgi:hypothetical protein